MFFAGGTKTCKILANVEIIKAATSVLLNKSRLVMHDVRSSTIQGQWSRFQQSGQL